MGDIQISVKDIQISAKDRQIRAKDIQIVKTESLATDVILQREEALRELNSVKEEKKENLKALFRKFSEGASVRVCVNIPSMGLLKGDMGVVHRISLRTAALEGNPGKDVVTVAVAGKGSFNVLVSQLELFTFVGPLPADFDSMC